MNSQFCVAIIENALLDLSLFWTKQITIEFYKNIRFDWIDLFLRYIKTIPKMRTIANVETNLNTCRRK